MGCAEDQKLEVRISGYWQIKSSWITTHQSKGEGKFTLNITESFISPLLGRKMQYTLGFLSPLRGSVDKKLSGHTIITPSTGLRTRYHCILWKHA